MTSDLRDPLGHALDELRLDLSDVHLASPADVRSRGDQRSRRQRAALGAGTVVAVAAIAVGSATLPGALSSGPTHGVPPAGGTPTVTSTSSATPSTATSPSAPTVIGPRPVIDLQPVGVGHVPAAYFLPGELWTGPDLVHGQTIQSIEPKEFEGSVQRFSCDPDSALEGDVAFLQAAGPTGTIVGTQKVRLLSDPGAAATAFSTFAAAMPGCQDRLREQATRDAGSLPPGETAPNPTAEITEDETARVDDASGSVRLFRTVTDHGTGAGSRLVEWVAVVREGAAVSLIDLNEFEKGDASFATLRRIATEARQQMAWAATRS
jgi:hypothetical protein